MASVSSMRSSCIATLDSILEIMWKRKFCADLVERFQFLISVLEFLQFKNTEAGGETEHIEAHETSVDILNCFFKKGCCAGM